MTPKDISGLLIYSARYAISRHTYASGEVGRLVTKYASVMHKSDAAILTDDIQRAFKQGEVDEYSIQDWKEALDALNSDQVTSEPLTSQKASQKEPLEKEQDEL